LPRSIRLRSRTRTGSGPSPPKNSATACRPDSEAPNQAVRA
jgi:hypothetical protein